MPAYQQVEDKGVWICFDGEKWMVQPTKDKGTSSGWAKTVGACAVPWEAATDWEEADGHNGWRDAKGMKVRALQSAEEAHAVLGEQEETAERVCVEMRCACVSEASVAQEDGECRWAVPNELVGQLVPHWTDW